MEFTASYEGSNFDEWLSFARLDRAKSALADIGVEAMEDLVDVCGDEELLQAVKGALSAVDFVKFKKAVKKTKYLEACSLCSGMDTVLTTLSSATSKSSASTTKASSKAATGTASGLDHEIEAMRKRISEMKAGGETAGRVEDMKKKLKEAEDLRTELITLTESRLKSRDEEKRLKKKLLFTKQRRRLLHGLEDRLRSAASLDICFALDCTGSMGSYIAASKNNIHEVVDSVRDMYPDVPLRLAFVGYRDHCDGDKRLAVLRFSSDVASFKSFVNAQSATGGGDTPEDVFGALSVVIGLDWQAATRLFFHIGDAPCHGRAYHSCDDSYPDGDPNGLKAERLIPDLLAKKVEYSFCRINSYTDQMIRMFNDIAGSGKSIATINVAAADSMMRSISTSVTSSLYTSLCGSSTTDTVHEKEDVIIDSSEPVWHSLRSETVHEFAMRVPKTLAALLTAADATFVEALPVSVSVKTALRPFSAGAVRAAHKVQVGSTIVVHKFPLSKRSKDAVREKFEHRYISTYSASAFLAQEFMKVRPSGFPGVRYADCALIQYLERPGTPYATKESMLEGKFEKYNNNSGMVCPIPSIISGANHEVVQAFSHWTYHITGGKMMVVDCQGVFHASSNFFVLTDPAIHCTDVTRFGGTNCTTTGMKQFFKTHKCGDCCRRLGLSKPAL